MQCTTSDTVTATTTTTAAAPSTIKTTITPGTETTTANCTADRRRRRVGFWTIMKWNVLNSKHHRLSSILPPDGDEVDDNDGDDGANENDGKNG